ncbi:ankyrin repeat-containing domain protein [Pelagophyceae sp. CCMP2097]|nr:ankyrin repeat-containing domain protein [Pelagophyceae sp. CCMP2097]
MDAAAVALLASLPQADKNAKFRAACGAFVQGAVKAGARAPHDTQMAAALLAAGADVDSGDGEGWTALHWCTAESRLSVVKFLLETRVNVDAVDAEGCTPLWCCAFNGEYQSVLHLLAAGADDRIKGSPKGEMPTTPAHAARCQRNATIADIIDAEASLRRADANRLAEERAGNVSLEALRATIRGIAKNPGTIARG